MDYTFPRELSRGYNVFSVLKGNGYFQENVTSVLKAEVAKKEIIMKMVAQ
jgi:hypothetical protein